VRLLVDAQLPRRVAQLLRSLGHDAIHTLDLPDGNRTKDAEVRRVSIAESRIVISKDSDFVDSFILRNEPYALLWVTTGNVSNDALCDRLTQVVPQLVTAFQTARYVELGRDSLVIHQ
jgi:predicted nuclease of predicted toxin-antitoxin system